MANKWTDMSLGFRRWAVLVGLVGTLFVSGCSGQSQLSSVDTASGAPVQTPVAEATVPAASPDATDPYAALPRLEGEATVELRVKGSTIALQIDGKDAPITAGNFVDLVNRGVYDGLMFHRVVRQPQPFVVQGGDPQSKDPSVPISQLGTGSFIDPATSAPRYIPLEIKANGEDQPTYGTPLDVATQTPVLKHTRGVLSMARSPLPNSASSQFYITLADLSFLDGQYAVFGSVTQGMDIVDQIQQGDRIESARVTSGLDNLRNSGQ